MFTYFVLQAEKARVLFGMKDKRSRDKTPQRNSLSQFDLCRHSALIEQLVLRLSGSKLIIDWTVTLVMARSIKYMDKLRYLYYSNSFNHWSSSTNPKKLVVCVRCSVYLPIKKSFWYLDHRARLVEHLTLWQTSCMFA